jgi:hypothetical protein
MASRDSVKQTIDEVEAVAGCPVQVVQDSSIKNIAVSLRRSYCLGRTGRTPR